MLTDLTVALNGIGIFGITTAIVLWSLGLDSKISLAKIFKFLLIVVVLNFFVGLMMDRWGIVGVSSIAVNVLAEGALVYFLVKKYLQLAGNLSIKFTIFFLIISFVISLAYGMISNATTETLLTLKSAPY